MSGTLDLCEKYFGTRDLYDLLNITKDTLEKDIKKAYYRLSLKVHPDRVPEEEKKVATEKFKVLSKIYEVLTDKNRKDLYDENGTIDDDDDATKISSWLEIWRKIFKPLSTEDINNYEKEYVNSDLEKADIKKAYLHGKGCINFMMESVPFMSVEDEPRISKIVEALIEADEVPKYELFFNEPKAKRNRRHKKYAREEKKSIEIKKRIEKDGGLEMSILKRQKERENNMESFFNMLTNKYKDVEDSEESISIENIGKKRKKSAKEQNKSLKAKRNVDSKPNDRRVRSGRVHKQSQ